jgi:hypothetical protein
MDKQDFYLWAEENRLEVKKYIALTESIIFKLDGLLNKYEAPPKQVEVTGKLEVNTEKTVKVDNLLDLKSQFEEMANVLKSSIEENSHKPHKTIIIENVNDLKQESLRVSNLNEVTDAINEAISQIDVRPIIKVEKQQIDFPRSAKDAIPVRLSDGKSFYNAIFSAVSSSSTETDPLVGYQPADIETVGSTKYYGFSRKNGSWYIMRELSGAYRYAVGTPQPQGGGLYIDAWTNKVNLDYDYFHEVFNA